ncbi:hypothetical protein EG329_008030 [Mollisiaceae sp. DMI_Dod_QoI]|nr:hypothetical protein EG329_008030 [Helotiales sp. DMI_Dod_QoI]
MNLLPGFLILFITCHLRLVQALAANFYGIALEPHAPIIKFDITVLIPNTSSNPLMVNNIQAFWPGLEPDPSSALYQQVITNQGGGPEDGTSCHFGAALYPGDTLTTLFRWNPMSQNWFDNWLLQPGEKGHAAGETPTGGGLITDGHFDTAYKNSHYSPFKQALIMIELQRQGVWDWGQIIWSNIVIEAQTTSTDWCAGNWEGWRGPDNKFEWNNTEPVATYNAQLNTTTCYIAEIVFISPN